MLLLLHGAPAAAEGYRPRPSLVPQLQVWLAARRCSSMAQQQLLLLLLRTRTGGTSSCCVLYDYSECSSGIGKGTRLLRSSHCLRSIACVPCLHHREYHSSSAASKWQCCVIHACVRVGGRAKTPSSPSPSSPTPSPAPACVPCCYHHHVLYVMYAAALLLLEPIINDQMSQ